MWEITEDLIKKKLRNHKKSASNRGIACDLTKQDLRDIFNINGGICDYTGEPMVLHSTEDYNPDTVSLERVDEHKCYTRSNLLLVKVSANHIKSMVLENKNPHESKYKLTHEIKETINSICEVIYNPVKLKQVQSKYINFNGETIMQDETTIIPTEDEAQPQEQELTMSSDVCTAKSYFRLGELVGSVADFELSFAQYKAKMKKVKCELTGNKFAQDEIKALHWLDKTKPFSKENTLVTTKVISESLDVFMANTKLSLTELKKLCKVIVNK